MGNSPSCAAAKNFWNITNTPSCILRSWDRASLIYSKETNKMQRYTMVFIINVLHASGGSSAHHQELKTVYAASGICRVVII